MKRIFLLLITLTCSHATWAGFKLDAAIVPIESRTHEGTEEDERAAKEALQYLMQRHAIPLTVNASCSNVGVRGDAKHHN